MKPENHKADSPLKGQVILISGGSSELAGYTALSLAKLGARVCLCGRQADVLEYSAKKVREAGGVCLPVVSELESLESAGTVLNQCLEVFHKLDVLIIVSPFWAGGFIHEHKLHTWDVVISANLREAFILSRTVLPYFRGQKSGQIMSIGSESGLTVYPQDGAYNVAMHGLNSLMELIRLENSEFGIRTHSLSPGLALADEFDAEGKPILSMQDICEWVIFLLERPHHLRSSNPILI